MDKRLGTVCKTLRKREP